MSAEERPVIPRAQIVYGEIVYWVTIVACIICMIGPLIAMASPKNNVADPWFLYSSIFAGNDPHTVWEEVSDEFPGGHFWAKNFTKGDGFTQFGLALGCSVALWALLIAAGMYLIVDKVYLYCFLALWVAALVFLSASGIISGAH
jgi:hypothetical protein